MNSDVDASHKLAVNGDICGNNLYVHDISASGPPSTIPSTNYTGITGEIRMWAAATAPPGWLLCNGDLLDENDYSALYAVIGKTYGGGTTFKVPDFSQRFPCGPGTANNDGRSVNMTLYGTGGEQEVKLSVAQIPEHLHHNQHNHSVNESDTETGLEKIEKKNSNDVDGIGIEQGAGGGAGSIFGGGEGDGVATYTFQHTHEIPAHNTNHYTGDTQGITQTHGGNHTNLPTFIVVNFIIKW